MTRTAGSEVRSPPVSATAMETWVFVPEKFTVNGMRAHTDVRLVITIGLSLLT